MMLMALWERLMQRIGLRTRTRSLLDDEVDTATRTRATLSLLHYPPQQEVANRQYGIAPHTDNSLMTFLGQLSVPGLAVRMPSGHWRAVENKPGTFLVNTGNVITRWTNDLYLSTKHR